MHGGRQVDSAAGALYSWSCADRGRRGLAVTAVRIADTIALVAFVAYGWNVLAGKLAIVTGTALPRAGDVAEFLSLLLASAAFVTAAMLRERARAVAGDKNDSQGAEP